MRCPNCHSIIGDSWDYCNYCGYDLLQYRRREGIGKAVPYPDYYYARPVDYQKAYIEERNRNERYKNLVYFVLLGVSMALNFIELLVIVITNL